MALSSDISKDASNSLGALGVSGAQYVSANGSRNNAAKDLVFNFMVHELDGERSNNITNRGLNCPIIGRYCFTRMIDIMIFGT